MHLLKMHYYALFEKTLTNLSMQTFITFVSKRLIPLIVANLNVFCGKKGWKPAFFGLKHRKFFVQLSKNGFILKNISAGVPVKVFWKVNYQKIPLLQD